MEPAANLTSHNARIGHIRKFVMVPPERGHRLSLITIEDPPIRIGEWMRAACEDNASLAIDIDGLVNDHCQTLSADCSFTLAWTAEDGGGVTSKRLNVRYRAQDDDEKLEALGINGTERGQIMQHQRIYEGLARQYLTAQQGQIALMNAREEKAYLAQERQLALFERMMGMMGGQLLETQKLMHQNALEVDKQRMQFRRELEDLESALARAGTPEESSALEKALPLLQQAFPAIMRGFAMWQQAQKNTNGAPPPAAASGEQG